MNSPEQSYTRSTSQEPLLDQTIGDLFDQTVANYPDNEALVVTHQQIRWNYHELKNQVDQCARALIGLGVEKGDRVGIWSPNNSEWCITQFATAKIGGHFSKH